MGLRQLKWVFGLVLVMVFLGTGAVEAKAAQFTRATIRYDRMKANTPSTLQVVLVPVTALTETKIKLVFGAATVGAGQSAATSPIPVGMSGVPGLGTTGLGSGTSMVFNCGDLTVGVTYAFNITVGVTTPSAGGNLDTISTLDAGGSAIDSTTVLSRTITNDQVVITANVPATFTFVLSGNTDAFTTDLSSGSVSSTGGISVAVGTNAAKGWTGWVKSMNVGLSSVTTGEGIGTSGTLNSTPETCNVGTDCYVLDVGVTSGTGSGALAADPEYAGNGTTTGGTFSTSYQTFASRTGKTNGDTVWLKAHATMVATKAAGNDYTDTWTVIGAGNF
jgi:hypothetical protein